MAILKQLFNTLRSLKWYYQVAIAMISFVLAILLIRFLVWLVPTLFVILLLLLALTEGDIINFCWNHYKQSKQNPANPFFVSVYHWLTENVQELPISTLQFAQGIEFTNTTEGIYFVHIEKPISDVEFEDFEIKVRQAIEYMSNGITDCIVSRSKRDPFLAIKIRLVSANELSLQLQQQAYQKEDF